MTLPVIETQQYELTLPSKDTKVKFRPFLVKEEKVLLQALESENQSEIITALKMIVSACTFNTINVDECPTFDLEYIFLQIRSKSVGEIAKIKVLCPDDKKTYVETEVDLSKVDVLVDDAHNNNIVIDESRKLGVIMKYPTVASIDVTKDYKNTKTDTLFEVIGAGIETIYEGDSVFQAKDYTKEDLMKFIENLDGSVFQKLKDFYESMPKLQHEIEIENPKTGVKSKVVLSGLQDFFG
tara:strand:- start:5 stop:721 length:717 start_codon:yes stop_codon:yes gene_type:complete